VNTADNAESGSLVSEPRIAEIVGRSHNTVRQYMSEKDVTEAAPKGPDVIDETVEPKPAGEFYQLKCTSRPPLEMRR